MKKNFFIMLLKSASLIKKLVNKSLYLLLDEKNVTKI